MVRRLVLLAFSFATGGAAMCSGAASPPIAKSLYDEAQVAYWREDNATAFVKCVELIETHPASAEAQRARYLMEVIWGGKLRREESARLAEQLQSSRPWLAACIASKDAESKADWNRAAALLFKYIAEAPDDGWRKLGLQRLCAVLPSAKGCEADVPTVTQAIAQLRRMGFRDCDNELRDFAYRVYFRGGNDPNAARLRAEWQRLFYTWSQQWGEGLGVVLQYLAASATNEAKQLAEELVTANPREATVYTQLSSAFAQTGEAETALRLLRRGCNAVDVPQQAELRNAFLNLCRQQWHQVEALAFLNELPAPLPSEVAEQIRSLRQGFGGLYLAEKTLPIKIAWGTVVLRRDGTFVVLERNGEQNTMRIIASDGHEMRRINPPEDDTAMRAVYRCFGLFPDQTVLYGRLRLSEDGSVLGELPLPRNLWDAAVNEAGEVAAATPRLYLLDTTGRCILSNAAPAQLIGGNRAGFGFCGDKIFAAKDGEVFVVSRYGEVVGTLTVPDDPQAFRSRPVQRIVGDARGFIYVLVGDKVQIFDPQLRWVLTLGGFNGLRAVTVDRSGVLYLTTFAYTIKLIPQNGGVWALAEKKSQP